MEKKYASIIIDICHSKDYNDLQRSDIQEKLFSIIQFINSYYRQKLATKFEFSSGDSIQALFYKAHDAFNSYWLIKYLFYPIKIRCGIGFEVINEIILNKNYDNTNMLDGTAYHLAICALNDCKRNNFEFLLCSNKYSNYKDRLVNQIMRTVELLNLNLTNRQADVFNIFNLLYPIDVKEENESILISYIFENISEKFNFDKKANANFDSLKIEIIKNYLSEEKRDYNLFGDSFPTKMNYICSLILNVSRQNIEKIRSIGKFDEIRKLEYLVFDYIKKEY